MTGAMTRAELLSTPGVVAELTQSLDTAAFLLSGRVREGTTLFVGCGSSHLVGGLAATLLTRAGARATAVVSSDVLDGLTGPAPGTVVAVSRSGRTSETLEAVSTLRALAPGAAVVAVVCGEDSPLADIADHTVQMTAAAEKAVAQTRSVAAAVAFGVLLAARARGEDGRADVLTTCDRLSVGLDRLDEAATEVAAAHGPGRLVVLGGAERWWLAREVVLKATEMGRVDASPDRVMEYVHGPVEALTRRDTVVVLPAPSASRVAAAEAGVVERLRALAGQVAGLDFPYVPVPLLGQTLAGHLLALALADRAGVDADTPTRLSPFVTVDLPKALA